jgi:molecular chaperone HscB
MDMRTADFQQDFFRLFNLPSRYQIDSAALEQSYRALQAQVHPDKFAQIGRAHV